MKRMVQNSPLSTITTKNLSNHKRSGKLDSNERKETPFQGQKLSQFLDIKVKKGNFWSG